MTNQLDIQLKWKEQTSEQKKDSQLNLANSVNQQLRKILFQKENERKRKEDSNYYKSQKHLVLRKEVLRKFQDSKARLMT